MAIRWKIPFMTLRSNTLLTVNVYDSTFSGTAMVLKGASQPFETQEDESDEIFTPVRLQSGYLRIADDGFAADGTTAFNWRDFIPTTDTDRPVTLTDANDNVLWQGFLQAQNFGATLFGNPQIRDFPVQCSLSVTQGIDINFSQKEIKNFAYLLKQIIDAIPSTCRPTSIVVQGDALLWLSEAIDWQLFVDEDDDYTAIAKYKMYDCLEEMCKFWGWTARTAGQTLYLLCPDDVSVQSLYTFTYAQLSTLADNGSVTITPSSYGSVTISSDFADDGNKDYQMRGVSKATFGINSDSNKEVITLFDHRLEVAMEDEGWTYGVVYGEDYIAKTGDIYNVDRTGFFASATTQLDIKLASFNRLKKFNGAAGGYGYGNAFDVIMFKYTYSVGGPPHLTMQTKYMHSFSDGFFRFLGETYVGAEKYEQGDFYAGDYDMFVKLGVGTSRDAAKWWDGREWSDSETMFRLTLGNKKSELFSRYRSGATIVDTSIVNTGTLYGYVYLDFYGSENMPETDGHRSFNVGDFRIEFKKNNTVKKQQYPNSGWYVIVDREIERKPYKSENENAIFDEFNTDSIFSSEKTSEPSYGTLLTSTGGYLSTVQYNGNGEHPEQHFVNRVTSYWSQSRRKIEANLLTHNGSAATDAAAITPKHMVSIDGTIMHPISISQNWRDDVLTIAAMEMAMPTCSVSISAAHTNLGENTIEVNEGSSYQATVTADEGYNITSVTITMGGVDITGTAYNSNTKEISIASVTGDVVITAVAEALPYDSQVEYLQGDGVAYINTGIATTYNTRIRAEVNIMSTAAATVGAFGARKSGSSQQNCMLWYTDKGWIWRYGTDSTYQNNAVKGNYTLDNTSAARTMNISGASSATITQSSSSFVPTTDIYYTIFAVNQNGSLLSVKGHDLRVKSFKIYNGTSLVRDYIPVRKNGVGYLYDKVSNELFGNAASSGAFSYGNDKTT